MLLYTSDALGNEKARAINKLYISSIKIIENKEMLIVKNNLLSNFRANEKQNGTIT